MTNYETAVNILDLIDMVGEDEVNRILSDFSCDKNAEIETFVNRRNYAHINYFGKYSYR